VNQDAIEKLVELYDRQPRTIDDLPYTLEMEELLDNFDAAVPTLSLSRRDIYVVLLRLRKAGHLPRKSDGQAPVKSMPSGPHQQPRWF
jgi:hypothetical protein